SRVGVRKPDHRFYRLACELLAIEPNEAVFLDDLGINLKPARQLGMTTIKVDDPDAALDELERIVGVTMRSGGAGGPAVAGGTPPTGPTATGWAAPSPGRPA